ncbi:hypothetical protein EZV62_002016 [Acer yangbiense]|uniref:Uncharacterized protein n=1 Tax=Acer yangbiense TaxID=1000413 RepID=A0A5C7IVV4_9ROSI|nr:hypothetical protein EZV62_002016 [Acer yangbiense]
MKSFRFAINYNGRWDNLDYVDGQLIGELVENRLSYNELVEKTYILTGIDRNIYDIILYGMIKLRSRWTKYLVKRDNDIDFVFSDDSPIKEIYVDIEKRVDRGGGGCYNNVVNNVGCYITDFDTEDEKPNEHDYPSSPDDTFVRVEQGVSVEDGIGGTKNCGGTRGVTFGGPSYDPFPVAPSRWILPCAGQYSFVTTPATSNSQEGPLFVGQVFQDKHKLKTELGLYDMQERFDIRVRHSIKYRFEAGCKDINCQFTIWVVRKEHCMFWHVKKFIMTHTCEGDVYGGQFRAASANVIRQLYAPKLSSGANICPKDIMRDMREKHGVELLYMKAWMATQHARSTVYGKADETDEQNLFLYAFLSIQGFQKNDYTVITLQLNGLEQHMHLRYT